MDTSIFIRSYPKDFTWLQYCLRSIKKYCSGFKGIVLAVPNNSKHLLPRECKEAVDEVVYVRETTRGYIAQQITKLQAHVYCNSQAIMYVDSDCVFFEHCKPENFYKNDLPILLKTAYQVFVDHQNSTGKIQNVLNWKRVTEAALGFTVEYEYMRRIPIIYRVETLKTLHYEYPNIIQYCERVSGNNLSEFNILGAIAEKYHPELYHIQNTETEPLPKKYAEQYWSWGGMNLQLKEHLECVCK